MSKNRPVRSALRPWFTSLALFGKTLGLVYSKRSALRKWGYIESTKTKTPRRRDGSPIPWMNYQIIAFLEERLTPDLLLFEFGSGYSTSFFAARVKHVTSIERDAEWYAQVKKMVPANVDLILFDSDEGGPYCEAASRQGRKYDVIVIDADDRVECLREAPASLSERGVILLDDAQRDAYRQGMADLVAKRGFRKLDFEGLKPGAIGAYRTSLFYRSDNCLGL
ncbi:MAG TPA: hypothetical protein VLI71_10465 [Gammaproteobacteria bacterium]|nr:hypothetical protein [Gammaproteobacteria bacterium]